MYLQLRELGECELWSSRDECTLRAAIALRDCAFASCCESVTFHVCMSHVARMNELGSTYE